MMCVVCECGDDTITTATLTTTMTTTTTTTHRDDLSILSLARFKGWALLFLLAAGVGDVHGAEVPVVEHLHLCNTRERSHSTVTLYRLVFSHTSLLHLRYFTRLD